MTLEKNDWCERNLRASFARPVECIWHRLIEPGTKNYWNCQKNWSLTIKQKSIHCMKKVLEIFFSRPIKFLSSANIFFSWMRIFFLFSLWSSIFAVIDRRLQKKEPGVCSQRFVSLIWFFMRKRAKARIFGVFRLLHKVMRQVYYCE